MLESGSIVYQLIPSIVLRVGDKPEQYWAFDADEGDHYTLNESAHWVLSRTDGSISVAALLEEFLNDFDVDREQGSHDLMQIFREFEQVGLLRKKEAL